MKKSAILFSFIVIGILAVVLRIPKFLFSDYERGQSGWYLTRLPFIFAVIACCFYYSKKRKFLIEGGFIKPNTRNYWMLIFPLLFPGILFLSGKSGSCLIFNADVLLFAFYVISAALMEEVVFRGTLQGYIIKSNPESSLHTVTVVSSSFFAILHLSNLQYFDALSVILQVVYSFFIGLLLSAIHLRARNIWLLGVIHGLLNLCSKGLCGDIEPEITDSTSPTFINYVSGIGGLILINIPVLVIYFLLMSKFKKKAPVLATQIDRTEK